MILDSGLLFLGHPVRTHNVHTGNCPSCSLSLGNWNQFSVWQ